MRSNCPFYGGHQWPQKAAGVRGVLVTLGTGKSMAGMKHASPVGVDVLTAELPTCGSTLSLVSPILLHFPVPAPIPPYRHTPAVPPYHHHQLCLSEHG